MALKTWHWGQDDPLVVLIAAFLCLCQTQHRHNDHAYGSSSSPNTKYQCHTVPILLLTSGDYIPVQVWYNYWIQGLVNKPYNDHYLINNLMINDSIVNPLTTAQQNTYVVSKATLMKQYILIRRYAGVIYVLNWCLFIILIRTHYLISAYVTSVKRHFKVYFSIKNFLETSYVL